MADYRDEAGRWDARLAADGTFLGGALIEPSAAYLKQLRDSQIPAEPPQPTIEDKVNALLAASPAVATALGVVIEAAKVD